MKFYKSIILAGVALGSSGFAASADELADLKTQIESLNGRLSQMEASTSVPDGYQLMSLSKAPALVTPGLTDRRPNSYADEVTTISIVPTADAPAETSVQISGSARAMLMFWDGDVDENAAGGDGNSVEILSRGEVKIAGKTETAVGEVGAMVKLRADFEGFRDMGFGQSSAGNLSDVYMPEAWGYWALTPELTLGGGFAGTLANIGYGVDGSCTCYGTDNAPIWLNPGDRTQMRLSYASGPLSFGIALEDSDAKDPTLGLAGDADSLGASSEIKFAGDSFEAEVSMGWWDGGSGNQDAYQIGAGAKVGLGDMANISVAAGAGQGFSGSDYWKASILGTVNLSDTVSAQLGWGYADFDELSLGGFGYYGSTGTHYNAKVNSVLAGIYYDPVAQLTIGLEGEWQSWNSSANAAGTVDKDLENVSVDFVTVYRF